MKSLKQFVILFKLRYLLMITPAMGKALVSQVMWIWSRISILLITFWFSTLVSNGIILYCNDFSDVGKYFRYGESLGSGPSTFLASQQKTPVGGLILHSALASILRVFKPNIKKTHKNDLFPNIDLMKYINTYVFIIHGKKDSMIPLINAERLYA